MTKPHDQAGMELPDRSVNIFARNVAPREDELAVIAQDPTIVPATDDDLRRLATEGDQPQLVDEPDASYRFGSTVVSWAGSARRPFDLNDERDRLAPQPLNEDELRAQEEELNAAWALRREMRDSYYTGARATSQLFDGIASSTYKGKEPAISKEQLDEVRAFIDKLEARFVSQAEVESTPDEPKI